MPENDRYTIWGLIKYIFNLAWSIFTAKKNQEVIHKENEKLQETYDKIDDNKQKDRDKDLENRLDNMFK